MGYRWAVGLTTVPARRFDLLPETLRSLRVGGFEEPRLFVDGVNGMGCAAYEQEFGLQVTARYPAVRAYGAWILALGELYLRQPTAERYAIFQDDLVACRGLRDYLERTTTRGCVPGVGRDGAKGVYWNLFTAPSNLKVCPKQGSGGGPRQGWFLSNQLGRGAVGLVFDREGVQTLLSHNHLVMKPLDAHRGWKSIDGAVLTALKGAGWVEVVHNPSLLQHTGQVTTVGNKVHLPADSWRGADWDARSILTGQAVGG